jgi:catalase
VAASVKERALPATFDDHFSQVRLFFRSLTEVEKEHVAQAYTFELGKCYEQVIRERQLRALANIDTTLAEVVAEGLGLPAPKPSEELADVEPSPALAQVGQTWPVDGRQVGIIVGPDVDAGQLADAVSAVDEAGMVPLVVAPTGGEAATRLLGKDLQAQRTYLTAASVEFDAVLVASATPPAVDAAHGLDARSAAPGPEGVDPRVAKVLNEVWRHAKAIAAFGSGTEVLQAAGMQDTEGVVTAPSGAAAVQELLALMPAHRVWHRFPTTGRFAG